MEGSSSGEEERRGGRPGAEGGEDGGSTLRRTVVFWLQVVVLFLVIRTFVVQSFVIVSSSMEETLLVGDMVLVDRAALGSRIPGTEVRLPGYGAPARGQVVLVDPPHEEEIHVVKRLVGLPGDTLEMRDGTLFVDGSPRREPYVKRAGAGEPESHPWMAWQRDHLLPEVPRAGYRPTRDDWGPLVVPEGRYFLMGDNRERSLDSRYWGFAERWRLEGVARVIYFSYDRESARPFPFIREIRWGRIGDVIRPRAGGAAPVAASPPTPLPFAAVRRRVPERTRLPSEAIHE